MALAWLLPVVVCLLTWAFWDQLEALPWALFYASSIFAILVGGVRGGIGATVLGALCAWYFFVPPYDSFVIVNSAGSLAILLFVATGIAASLLYRALGEALRESQEKFARFFRSSPVALSVSRLENGEFVDVNNAFVEQFGYRRDELIGRTSVELGMVSAAARQPRQEMLMRTARLPSHEFQLRDKAGVAKDCLAAVEVLPLEGKPHLLISTVDISERRRLENALRGSEERLRLALEATSEGWWDWNLDTGEVATNDQWLRMFGYEPGEAPASIDVWTSRIHPDDFAAARGVLEEYLDGRRPDYRTEFRIITKAGAVRWHLSVGKAAARDASGRPRRMVGVNADISERKALEQVQQESKAALERQVAERTLALQETVAELQRANAGKDAFLAAVSHELRTPLMGILSMSELLECELRGPLNGDQVRYVQAIACSGRRLQATIDSVLHYTSLIAGTLAPRFERCRVAELCGGAIRAVEDDAWRKGQRLAQEVAPPCLEIESDAAGVGEVLKALLSNAVKFTPQGGCIELAARVRATGEVGAEGAVEIVVTDTGIGMSEEQLAALFRPFVQGDLTLARRYEGLGLGLAYAHKMVALLGGEMAVASELGKGSQFAVMLPARPPMGSGGRLPGVKAPG